jgi:2-keto-4-pentenoate hydratase/2-oxohepta-3-ene-1,7-dioic acid hydratase in catechol pathway
MEDSPLLVLRSKGLPWERAKAFNGSAVFSKFVDVNSINPSLAIELKIDGEIVQSGNIHQMIYKPAAILTELLTFMSLNDGDIVMTGTPKGVGIINRESVFIGKVKDEDKGIIRAKWVAK